MTLRPGAWLGLPSGLDPVADVPVLRVVLVLIALLSGVLLARGRRHAAAASALGFGTCALGFWLACLERPYGLLLDTGNPTALCELAVAHARADSGGGCVLGVAGSAHLHRQLGALGAILSLPADLVLSLPTLLPVGALLMMSVLLHLLPAKRAASGLTIFVWLGISTTQLDFAVNAGGLARIWQDPFALTLLPLAAVPYLALCRWLRGTLAPSVAAICIGLAYAGLGEDASHFSPTRALEVAIVAPGFWGVLGWTGALRHVNRPALGLLVSGLLLLALGAAGLPLDLDICHAWYRLGIVLGVVPLLEELVEPAGRALTRVWPR